MKRKTGMRKLAAVLSLVLLLTGISAFATAGGENDPLVSLSYLNETFLDTVTEKVKEVIAVRDKALKEKLNKEIAAAERELAKEYGSGSEGSGLPGEYEAATFVLVTLEKGQTLTGLTGCELLLRVGKATCVASSSPGLIDTTSGKSLSGGSALEANHLYMATVDGRGLKATTDTVKVLVRGPYVIE